MSKAAEHEALAAKTIRWVRLWLGANVAIILADAAYLYLMAGLPADARMTFWESPEELATFELLTLPLWLAALLTMAVSGFLVLKWIYRSNAIAQGLAEGMTVSPGWNVGWFFVPIAFFWKPLDGVSETWRVSHNPANWRADPTPDLLKQWWGLWIASTILSNISFRIGVKAETVQGNMTSIAADLISSIVTIPLCLVLIRVIRQLTETQVRRLTEQP